MTRKISTDALWTGLGSLLRARSFWSRRRWAALLALSRQEFLFLLEAWVRISIAAMALWILPLPRTQALLQRLPAIPGQRPPLLLPRMAELVDLVGRHHLWRVTCLQRSLAFQSLLRCRGCEAELRIGVRKAQALLQAHAWLEIAEQPIGEAPEVSLRFPALTPVPPGGAQTQRP